MKSAFGYKTMKVATKNYWFEVLFIVATNEDVRTVARQSYTGAREKLTELARSQKGEAIPPPYVPSRGSNIIHQGQLMKMSAASA